MLSRSPLGPLILSSPCAVDDIHHCDFAGITDSAEVALYEFLLVQIQIRHDGL